MARKPPLERIEAKGQFVDIVPTINFDRGFSVKRSAIARRVDVTVGGGFDGPGGALGDQTLRVDVPAHQTAVAVSAKSPAAAFKIGGATGPADTLPTTVIEKYDPATRLFSPAGALDGARLRHTAVTLRDGRILVLGGYAAPAPLLPPVYSVELYDPTTGLATSAHRNAHVLKAVPAGPLVLSALEAPGALYVASGGFVAMNVITPGAPYPPTAASIGGQTLMRQVPGAPAPGEYAINALTKTLTFNGADVGRSVVITFIYLAAAVGPDAPAPMLMPRGEHGAVLLDDGRVLVVGGDPGHGTGPSLSACEIYDPGTGTWSATGGLVTRRTTTARSVVKLPDGRVLVTGGSLKSKRAPAYTQVDIVDSAEVYDPVTGVWAVAPSMSCRRDDHASCLLASGHVLVCGGAGETADLSRPSDSAELYAPDRNFWRPLPRMLAPRAGASISPTPTGAIIYGGVRGFVPETGVLSGEKAAELYDGLAGVFAATESAPPAECGTFGAGIALLPGGDVLFVSGTSKDSHQPAEGAALFEAQ